MVWDIYGVSGLLGCWFSGPAEFRRFSGSRV